MRSHQRVTGKGAPWSAASTSLTSARSTISAWFCPKTVGNLATDATIRTGTENPLTETETVDPMRSGWPPGNRCVAMAGTTWDGGCAVIATVPVIVPGSEVDAGHDLLPTGRVRY